MVSYLDGDAATFKTSSLAKPTAVTAARHPCDHPTHEVRSVWQVPRDLDLKCCVAVENM